MKNLAKWLLQFSELLITKFVEKYLFLKMGVAQLVKKFRFYSEDEGSRLLQHVGN
jgi:hypothetical protein